MKRTVAVLVTLTALTQISEAQSLVSTARWFRGNLHTHTINSDGDSTSYEVMAWYKRHGYHFLAITDHNTFTDPSPIDSNPNDNFLLIGAEEVTNGRNVHVNALGITRPIPAQVGSTDTELLQASIDAIRAQGGVPLINHPNWRWTLTAEEMLPLRQTALLEIAGGVPVANHEGDGVLPSSEQLWDQLLSAGMRVFAVAVDDAHVFRQEFIDLSTPGRGWVMVRAPSLSRDAILAALESGDFYASTGVTLKDIRATPEALSVEIDTGPVAALQGAAESPPRYRVLFYGRDGRVLATSRANPARYAFTGNEGYVRARIEDSNGRRAWTQPTLVRSQ